MVDEFIPVFRPNLGEEELDMLREVFKSGWIGLGPKTAEFETKFADYVEAEYAVALNSATAGLHLAVAAFRIGPSDEVLVPSLSFVSTAHCVVYTGATPVFCDIEPDTLNIDLEDAAKKINERTRAIIVVHYGGLPCDMDAVHALARQHNLLVIEDASHACGSRYKGRPIGGLSDATVFSFHAVKNLPTGDGGMVTTNRVEVMQALRKLRWVGIDKSTWDRTEETGATMRAGIRRYAKYSWYYEVNDLGYKYHMNDISAAIGLVQLGKVEAANDRRREIAAQYTEMLGDLDWVETPVTRPYAFSAQHNYVIKTPYRDALREHLSKQGISTGVHYMPIHLHPYYRRQSWMTLPVIEETWVKLLTLPLFPDLTDQQVQYIVDAIHNFDPAKDT
jgi:perosamine synthetase